MRCGSSTYSDFLATHERPQETAVANQCFHNAITVLVRFLFCICLVSRPGLLTFWGGGTASVIIDMKGISNWVDGEMY